jgi:hypothetical protein
VRGYEKVIPRTATTCKPSRRSPLTSDSQYRWAPRETLYLCNEVQMQLMKSLHNLIERCAYGMIVRTNPFRAESCLGPLFRERI